MSKDETVAKRVAAGVSETYDKALEIVTAKDITGLELLKIGKPSAFSNTVDPEGRIQGYIESKMSVIDLIPCDYLFPLAKAQNLMKKEGTIDVVKALTPAISYEQAVTRYREICKVYGLPGNYGGIRLYLTDDTTATDEFSSTYTDNIIQGAFNAAVDKTKTMRDIGRSITTAYDEWARDVGTAVGTQFGKGATKVAGVVTGGENVDFTNLGASIGSAIMAGNKISLPKLWSDSSYNPNISAVVKLVSPYGHPSAIKEFIIKPLMHLLIMSAARTRDGISYGQSPKMTVKAYGMSTLPLAHISSVSLRRGGADTSFNIYRQPLSIDVSVQFQSLVDGFAVFEGSTNPSEESNAIYEGTDEIRAEYTSMKAGQRAMFQTLGTVVDSLRPFAINRIVTKHNISELPRNPGLQTSLDDPLIASNLPGTIEEIASGEGEARIDMDRSDADANRKKAGETTSGQIGMLANLDTPAVKTLLDQSKINN